MLQILLGNEEGIDSNEKETTNKIISPQTAPSGEREPSLETC